MTKTEKTYNRTWGKEELSEKLLLDLMKTPLKERMSLRQLFYTNIRYFETNSPKEWVKDYNNWGELHYGGLIKVASALYLEGRFSYEDAGIIDNSGASEYIYQTFKGMNIPPEDECTPDFRIEVWVENNATFNSLLPLVHWSHRKERNYVKLNLLSGKGFTKSQQIEQFERYRADDVDYVLVLSDFDPSGYSIGSHDVANRFRQRGIKSEVIHVGLFPEQIPEDRRTVSLAKFKKNETRSKAFIKQFGGMWPIVKQGYGYEIQALTPREIRMLVLLEVARRVHGKPPTQEDV